MSNVLYCSDVFDIISCEFMGFFSHLFYFCLLLICYICKVRYYWIWLGNNHMYECIDWSSMYYLMVCADLSCCRFGFILFMSILEASIKYKLGSVILHSFIYIF